jgi:hypothetical protein
LWLNNTILFMQYTKQFLVHNKHTCWGGLAIVASREEDKVYCCCGAEVVPMRWDWQKLHSHAYTRVTKKYIWKV